MGKLISIVGNSGSGKTTLTRLLGEIDGFQIFLEEHIERPFQAAFMQDKRFGLANQFDYLLYRAEQERTIRHSDYSAVQDGGLDLDFHVFTRLFYRRGYLNATEFELCERLYRMLRGLLPSPDLIVCLQAPLDVLAKRKAARSRKLDVSLLEDLQVMETYMQEWLQGISGPSVLVVDSAACGPDFKMVRKKILASVSR